MEPIAENRITVNKKIFYEGMLRISRDGYEKAARRSMVIFLAMWLVLLFWTIVSGGNLTQTFSYLILIGLIGMWVCLYLPRHSAGRSWKAQEAKYGPTMERFTQFYTDRLVVTGEGIEKEILYTDIDAIKESRTLLILLSRDNTGVMLARNGFTGKNETEIKALIQGAQR